MAKEIERKFFYKGEVKASSAPSSSWEQGYLPDSGKWEFRLRRESENLRLTLKLGGGLSRQEWELSFPKQELEANAPDLSSLWELAKDRLKKNRTTLSKKPLLWEIDRYEGTLAGLKTVEIEFTSREEARKFRPPKDFGYELTYDPRYKNRELTRATAELPLSSEWPSATWSYGGLPFRKKEGKWEILIVSTRGSERWIFPKGQPEKGLTPSQVALMECQEEAGAKGKVVGHPLLLPYERDAGLVNLVLFPLQLSKLEPSWLEEGQRERQVIPLDYAKNWGKLVTLGAEAIHDLYSDL